MRRSGLGLALFLFASTASATNGYFAHGYSAAQRGMGGAGTAYAADALISTINPAGSVWVGERLDLNLSLFKPIRDYDAGESSGAGLAIFEIAPENLRSGRELFGIPGFAYVRPIDERSSLGLSIYGNGGLNTVYKGGSASFAKLGGLPLLGGITASECAGSFGGGSAQNADLLGFCGNGKDTTSVDLIQLFVAPNYAYKVTDTVSLGIAPIFAAQRFQAKGLNAFAKFSNSPDRVSDQGYSFSYGGGARLGVMAQLHPMLDVGASWQSRIYMTRFKEYEGLFAEQGDFDIPSTWNVGVAFKPTANQRLLIDVQHINFNEIASVGLPLNPNRFVNDCALPRLLGSNSQSDACLGSSNGPGFGWQDMTIYKVGYEYLAGEWRLRAGYSETKQPIPSSEVLFNVLAPGVIEKHYTLGATHQVNQRLGIDVAFMYAPNNPVRGKNPLSRVQLFSGGQNVNADADESDQDIVLDMRQIEVTIGLNFTY